ncbi:hypothetical protein DICA4_D12794 [Diutina catenulata]
MGRSNWMPWGKGDGDTSSSASLKGNDPSRSPPAPHDSDSDGASVANSVKEGIRDERHWEEKNDGDDADDDDRRADAAVDEMIAPHDDGDDEDIDNEEEESASRKRKGWTFWRSSSASNEGSDSEEVPAKRKAPISANTIIPVEDPEDAVLYKPHDKAKQFNQIKDHDDEYHPQNCIVPEWGACLPNQKPGFAAGLFGAASSTQSEHSAGVSQGSSQAPSPPKMDLGNWRQYLSSLSSRLGFGSIGLPAVVQHGDLGEVSDANRIEHEVNLLYERTYRLYGKSLAKLPAHKRACLPNYSQQFDPSHGLWLPPSASSSEAESDADDASEISIQDDPMGNLLINHRRKQWAQSQQANRALEPAEPGQLRKIKKILIIGVHGFFPTKMIRPLIGAPKGTSLKFANEAERAILRYCHENGLISAADSNDMSIQKIALEKEGKIFDRVGFFTEVLIKWRQELNDADFIFVAAHSQGCVVSIILLARLIAMGILENPLRKRIGILGMAGINNGPFYGAEKSFFMKAYSTIEHDSLLELFELTKFDTHQSKEYKQSMQIIVNCNVKICFIGSVNDQLVPLYSALASHVFHPNIYRACYIDHSSNTPLFIQKLVSLCCHLQNIGYFDNNVLKELSPSLAGPMTGGGHSKIYNDGKVYDMGIKFILDTDDIVVPPSVRDARFLGYDPKPHRADLLGLHSGNPQPYGGEDMGTMIVKIPETNQVYIKEYNVSKIGSNPFILPWCLRGLLFNIERNWPNSNKLLSVESAQGIGKSGYDEINELFEQFEAWRPDTKQMKDLKYRLNGMRVSKL